MKLFLVTLLFCVGLDVARAQSPSPVVMNTLGNTLYDANTMVEISVGEFAVATLSSVGHFLTQGLLQPDYQAATGINKMWNRANISCFPNPFTETLTIQSSLPLGRAILTDMQGKTMLSLSVQNHTISPGYLAAGMYQLMLFDLAGNPVAAFKLTRLNP